MSEEENPEFSRYCSSMATMTSITTGMFAIILTLLLFLADTTNGIVGIVLFLLYISMMLGAFVAGEFWAYSYYYVHPKPKMTTRGSVANALIAAVNLLWMVAMAFLFLVKNLAYHFAIGITVTIIVYVAMVAYTFAGAWKTK